MLSSLARHDLDGLRRSSLLLDERVEQEWLWGHAVSATGCILWSRAFGDPVRLATRS